MTTKHATRVVGDKVEWTGARDERGDLIAPTADDLARLGPEQFTEYQQRRQQDRDQRAARKAEEERFEEFKRQFIASGGAPADARGAFAQMKRDDAAKTARRADEEARLSTHAETMGAI